MDADPRRPQLLDLLMMESASRTDGFRIQGADLDLLCRLAGRPPPDDHWGGDYEDNTAYGNPINPTLDVDREVFHGIFGDYPDEVVTGPLRLSTCEVEALVRALRAVPPPLSAEEIESALLHSVVTTAESGSFHRCRSSSPFQLPLRDAVISTLSLHIL